MKKIRICKNRIIKDKILVFMMTISILVFGLSGCGKTVINSSVSHEQTESGEEPEQAESQEESERTEPASTSKEVETKQTEPESQLQPEQTETQIQQTETPTQPEESTETSQPEPQPTQPEEPTGTSQPEPQPTEAGKNTEAKQPESGTPFGNHGSLSVSGTQLVDKNGNAFILRGISTHGLSWFPDYVNYDLFKQMRDEWNVNVVRLAMYTAEYNGYCTGDDNNRETLKKLIDAGVNYGEELGLYVIIDWHILSDNNPNIYKREAIDFFREISAKYAGRGNVIYEICNEPNGGTGWGEIKSYAEEIINVIRENDSNAIVIVGTPTWSQDVDVAADDKIIGDNIMYAMHFYADTHRDYIREKLVTAHEKGLPVIISEFGICDASGNGGINYDEASKWMTLLNQYSVSYVMWNLSNKSETSAMIQSWCNKSSGFTYDELSDAGKWFVESGR